MSHTNDQSSSPGHQAQDKMNRLHDRSGTPTGYKTGHTAKVAEPRPSNGHDGRENGRVGPTNGGAKSKEQLKKEKQQQKEARRREKLRRQRLKIEQRLNRPYWVKLSLGIGKSMVKILFILGLFAISVVLGLVVGMGIVGDASPAEALDPDTWRHIYRLIFPD